MKKKLQFILLLITAILSSCHGQNNDALKIKIQRIIDGKKAKVGVSIADKEGKEVVSINGKDRFPLQSVFKFHVAVVVFSRIDQGNLSLAQMINITKNDLLPDIYSPIKKNFPNGTKMTLREILAYTVSQSDNIGCDILLRLIGGPQVVEAFFVKHKFKDLSIKINEETQQASWNSQFRNWTLPGVSNDVLWMFFNKKQRLLSQNSYSALWQMMTDTSTGKARIKALLPQNTIVSHKTGTSGQNPMGVTAAVNDVGLVTMPNGEPFVISVFVSDSKEPMDVNERIIAEIAKAAWDFFKAKDQ